VGETIFFFHVQEIYMPSPLGFNGGLTISLQCKDRARSIKWYGDVLGFTLLYDVAEIGWCEMATEVKGVNVGLSSVEKPKTGAGPVPTFGVNDVDKARKLLEAKDVRFDGPTQEIPGMVKLATFFDPDGNALMLYQDLQKH
jgi:predicted enzyme related to lactoylglutathione lyase